MTATKPAASDKKKSVPKSAYKPAPLDAIALLEADHEAVRQLFAEFTNARSVASKRTLIAAICSALTVHVQIEEEIFYPAVQTALNDTLLVPEATVEHAGVMDLIAQLQGVEPDGEMYDARVKVLSEYVKHHVKEEHEEMFPKAKASSMDLMALGVQMAARRDTLLAHAG